MLFCSNLYGIIEVRLFMTKLVETYLEGASLLYVLSYGTEFFRTHKSGYG